MVETCSLIGCLQNKESTAYQEQLLAIQLVLHYLCCLGPKSRVAFFTDGQGTPRTVKVGSMSINLHQLGINFRSLFVQNLGLIWVFSGSQGRSLIKLITHKQHCRLHDWELTPEFSHCRTGSFHYFEYRHFWSRYALCQDWCTEHCSINL